MGLTSWAAFKSAGDQVMVTGDLVLQEDQVNPVLSIALDNGIEVTALHNHFLWDTPKVMFMHIGCMGDLDKLATSVGKIFLEIKNTSGGKTHGPHTPFAANKTSLDPKAIETIIGVPVEKAGEVYKVTIGRSTMMAGHDAGKAMGVNTWAAFAGSDKKAVVDGDFAMLESELQGVLKAFVMRNFYHRDSSPHDRRIAKDYSPALLGDRLCQRPSQSHQNSSGYPGKIIGAKP